MTKFFDLAKNFVIDVLTIRNINYKVLLESEKLFMEIKHGIYMEAL